MPLSDAKTHFSASPQYLEIWSASEVRVCVLTAINFPYTDLVFTKKKKWHEGVLIILQREIKVYSYELTNKLNEYLLYPKNYVVIEYLISFNPLNNSSKIFLIYRGEH